jgi:hypothetical protein
MARLIKLAFEGGYGERDEFETPLRGYRSDVLAELDDGSVYRITFYDPVRLTQTVEDDARSGTPYFTEPGLIIVPKVDREHMERAAAELAGAGFFAALRPVNQ